MKTFIILVSVLVCTCWLSPPLAYAAVVPKVMIPDPFVDPEPAIPGYNYWEAGIIHIAITDLLFYSKQDEPLYVGVEFPLYCGYIELTEDRRIIFVKKTNLPIEHVLFFFKYNEMLGGLPADEVARNVYGVGTTVPLTSDYAFKILMENMREQYMFSVKEFPPGEGKDFIPKFERTYPYIPGKLPSDRYQYLKLKN